MQRSVATLLMTLLFVAGCGQRGAEQKSIRVLKKLGAEFQKDDSGKVIVLHLRGRKVSDGSLEQVAALTSLQELYLGSSQISDAGLVHLKSLTRLEVLELDHTPITSDGLEHLQGLLKLKKLSIKATDVTDPGLEYLYELRDLEEFEVSYSALTGTGLKKLSLKLPDLTIINKGTTAESVNPVAGRITYDGKPLAFARIRLEVIGGAASRVYACDSRKDGSFDIEAVYSTTVKKGAPAGTYRVLVGKWTKDSYAAGESDPDAKQAAQLELIEENPGDDSVSLASPYRTQVNEKFNASATTPLRLEVKEGENRFTIELKSDGTGTVKSD